MTAQEVRDMSTGGAEVEILMVGLNRPLRGRVTFSGDTFFFERSQERWIIDVGAISMMRRHVVMPWDNAELGNLG